MKKTLIAVLAVVISICIVIPCFAVPAISNENSGTHAAEKLLSQSGRVDGSYTVGDLNGDGRVGDWDAIMLARYLAGWDVTIANIKAADVNGDGEVNASDDILMARYLAGWNVKFVEPVSSSYSLFVSNEGNDETGDGTLENPYATLYRARDAVREALNSSKNYDGITVYIRGGSYYMDESLLITEEDSGNENCGITYRAYDNEKVSLTGAKEIKASDFTEADDEIKNRIRDESARSHILQYDLTENGFTYMTSPSDLSLYCNGSRMSLARYPNANAEDGGFLRISGSRYDADTKLTSWLDTSGVVKSWQAYSDIMVYGYFQYDWASSEAKFDSYDPEEGRVYLRDCGTISEDENTYVGRYYYSNVLEELDCEGEYYIDPDTDILYIYAYENMDSISLTCSQLYDSLLNVQNADYYTFDGITFEGNLGNGIEVTDSDYFTLQNCEILNIREKGIVITGCNNIIYGNHIHHIGGIGIQMVMDYNKMVPQNGLICNNDIHDYAEIAGAYNPGIHCYGTDLTICHNEIHDSRAQAILPGGNDLVVEYNEIYAVCKESGDAGAIYTGGWNSNNDIFRYNYIHDIYSNGGHPHGIYVDDEGAGKIIYGNIMQNISGYSTLMGGGQNNQVYNNISINAAFQYDMRAWGWQAPAVIYPAGVLWKRFYNDVGNTYCSRIWSLKYPWTAQMRTTNVHYDGGQLDIADNYITGLGYAGVMCRNNATIALDHSGNLFDYILLIMADFRDNYSYDSLDEVGFVDAANGNYNLRPDSNIFRDIPGFEPIPFDQIGLLDAE